MLKCLDSEIIGVVAIRQMSATELSRYFIRLAVAARIHGNLSMIVIDVHFEEAAINRRHKIMIQH
jgi:hypothetical protein